MLFSWTTRLCLESTTTTFGNLQRRYSVCTDCWAVPWPWYFKIFFFTLNSPISTIKRALLISTLFYRRSLFAPNLYFDHIKQTRLSTFWGFFNDIFMTILTFTSIRACPIVTRKTRRVRPGIRTYLSFLLFFEFVFRLVDFWDASLFLSFLLHIYHAIVFDYDGIFANNAS